MAIVNVSRTETNSQIKAKRRQKQVEARKGTGRYLFKNRLQQDLMLPKPAEGNITIVGVNGTFIGDSYFMQLVPGTIFLVKDLNPPEEEQIKENKEELITEIPPAVKASEDEVVKAKAEESNGKLLIEQPAGAIEVITEEETKLNKCAYCGKDTTNKKFCSRKCTADFNKKTAQQ